eukprot:jgi/Mesvir1/10674/Mv13766-RA.1
MLRECLRPWLLPPPSEVGSYSDVHGEDIAWPDSYFINLLGINIHYKLALPSGEPSNVPGQVGELSEARAELRDIAAAEAALVRPDGESSAAPSTSLALGPQDRTPPEIQNKDLLIICLHGYASSSYAFRKVLSPLAKRVGIPVVAFDRPPFGLSARPLDQGTTPYTDEFGARLALELLDHLGVKKAIIVGHSLGAGVAIRLAQMAPRRTHAMCLLTPAVFGKWPPWAPLCVFGGLTELPKLAYLRVLLNLPGVGLNTVRMTIRRMRGTFYHGAYTEDPQHEDFEGYMRALKHSDWDTGLQLWMKVFDPVMESGSMLAKLEVPTTIVYGLQDHLLPPEYPRQLIQSMGARGVELNTGHSPCETMPEAVVDAVEHLCVNAANVRKHNHRRNYLLRRLALKKRRLVWTRVENLYSRVAKPKLSFGRNNPIGKVGSKAVARR